MEDGGWRIAIFDPPSFIFCDPRSATCNGQRTTDGLLAAADQRARAADGRALLAPGLPADPRAAGRAPPAPPAWRAARPARRADRRRPCAAVARRGEGRGAALRVLSDARVHAGGLQL